jgi:hypothetical protein
MLAGVDFQQRPPALDGRAIVGLGTSSSNCFDARLIRCIASGHCPARELASARAHLESCARCRDAVAAAATRGVRQLGDTVLAAYSPPEACSRRWKGAAMAASVVLVVAAVIGALNAPTPRSPIFLGDRAPQIDPAVPRHVLQAPSEPKPDRRHLGQPTIPRCRRWETKTSWCGPSFRRMRPALAII